MSVWNKDDRERNLNELRKKIGLRCWYCGMPLDKPTRYGRGESRSKWATIDHVEPRCKKGSDNINNKALCCWRCNGAKYDSDLEDFLEWLAHIRSSRFSCFILSRIRTTRKLSDTDFDLLRKD
jgi:5-methylcytosine-specific restriction endonuclease McrA